MSNVQAVQFRKVKSKLSVIITMILHGWWGLKNYGIKNIFGSGYWTKEKFAMCGKILRFVLVYAPSGKIMYESDVWSFQPMFLTKKLYNPSFRRMENGIAVYYTEVPQEGKLP